MDRTSFIQDIITRQIDLIAALECVRHEHAVELRYIAHPSSGSPVRGKVTVALLIQIAAPTEPESIRLATEYYDNLLGLLRSLFREYEWLPVSTKESFQRIEQPFEFLYIAEIIRREERVLLDTVCQPPRHKPLGFLPPQEKPGTDNALYYVLPFLPNRNTMEGVCRILLQQESPVLLSICIQPTTLTNDEEEAFIRAIERCEQYLSIGMEGRITDLSQFHPTLRLQAEALRNGYLKQMLQLNDAAFFLKIQVASPGPIQHGVVDSIGMSLTEHAGSRSGLGPPQGSGFEDYFSGGFESVIPSSEESLAIAKNNLTRMTFDSWIPSKAQEECRRLRYLFDINQAIAPFRLPIPLPDDYPGIETTRYHPLSLPREIPEQGLLLGMNRCQGMETPIHLLRDDRRRHMYVVGQTGTGKSNFFLNMIMQDIKNGEGVGVVDPHGELIDVILTRIPRERIDDVVYINPADYEMPVGVNLLEYETTQERDIAINQMMEIFDKLYDLRATGGPMFEMFMRNALYLVTEDPESGATLVDVPRVLANQNFRRYKLNRCQNEYVKRFWIDEALRAGGDASLANLTPYVTSKLSRFLYNELIRPIVSQARSTVNMREVMDQGKILLVNLSKGKLGDTNSAFLGMVIISKILAKALSRADVPDKSHVKDFYLYVDEFQNLATDTFITILSEARKYRLNLIITNQYIHQTKDSIQNAIFGNVGTLVSFRVGQLDAERLAKEYAPLVYPLDLMSLPNFNTYVRTLIRGESTKPFSMKTLMDQTTVDESLALLVTERSRKAYGRPAKQVDQEIQERWARIDESQKQSDAVAK